ncbi:hypothetical protein SCHPADRAFT_941019 [Schizopora paradoxa]|uniref:F-box domain-containing protein n=1 Tax=Schizopora paradoxa TaxID=27342 RepID=A0A0H2RLA0_9AGAM|nr:hypothetical protein SCHPADRAFT_941019 [Schizopora paradoxa]
MSISSSASFTNLPVEVIVRIFFSLDAYDLLAVSSLNKSCNNLFKNLLELEYELMAAGVTKGASSMNKDERLRALRCREERWRTLDMTHRVSVKVPHHCSTLYDISSGFYVLGGVQGPSIFDFIDKKTKFLRFADLSRYKDSNKNNGSDNEGTTHPGGERDTTDDWGEIKAEENATIVDFGLCIDEHDLIGLIELTRGPAQRMALTIRQFSTGAYHPAARKPTIDLGPTQSTWGNLSIMMEIVGCHLLLLLSWSSSSSRERLLLINWCSGEIIVEEDSPQGVWEGFVFLTPQIFVMTNMERRCLDAMHIPHNIASPATETTEASQSPRTSFARLASFLLPVPVFELVYDNIACRADPNPFGTQSDGTYAPGTERSCRALFSSDAEKAIIIFRMTLTARIGFGRIPINFVVHRSSLLHRVRKAHPWCESNLLAPKELLETVTIPWDDWGPPSTRWVFNDNFHTPWITTTTGQREVFMRGDPNHIVVRDYNPVAVRRAKWEMKNGVFDDMNGRRVLVTDSRPLMSWERVFTSNGSNGLPYIEVESKETFNYNGVLMDENHLLGLNRSNIASGVASFDIFTF